MSESDKSDSVEPVADRPEGVEQFYTPPRWLLSVYVGDALVCRYEPLQGHHLAAAAKELLTLYAGTGSDSWGMLVPGNRDRVRVTLDPLE